MHFELWHIPSGNLVNTYACEADALAVVRAVFEANGKDVGEAFALGTEDSRGRSRQVATGAALLARALADQTHQEARSA